MERVLPIFGKLQPSTCAVFSQYLAKHTETSEPYFWNLKTLKTDINTTYDICNVLINHPCPLISESGIKTKEELLELNQKTKIKTFLIGESLLKNLDNNSIFSVL